MNRDVLVWVLKGKKSRSRAFSLHRPVTEVEGQERIKKGVKKTEEKGRRLQERGERFDELSPKASYEGNQLQDEREALPA